MTSSRLYSNPSQVFVLLVAVAALALSGCGGDTTGDGTSTDALGSSSGAMDTSSSGAMDTSSSGAMDTSSSGMDTTPPAVCGDGILQGTEQCDDGNTDDADGCTADCNIEVGCGDGFLDAGEGCDDGSNDAGDGCSPGCQLEVCGNGVRDPGEQCDGDEFCTELCQDTREALPDADGDTIADQDEGGDALDFDGDGVPNYLDTDSDGDGLTDDQEVDDDNTHTPPNDTDGDGAPDYLDTDSDGDGISDLIEGADDADGDGISNAADTDSDGDGIPDHIEGSGDVDGDGTPNFLDTDADGDGVPDSVEGTRDHEGDGVPNYLDPDSDDDGIDDGVEAGADLNAPQDTDGDGDPDYLDPDSDGDGIRDLVEGGGDIDGDGTPNFADLDSDGDGIPDSVELARDNDGDGIPNFLDADSDGDGINDVVEGAVDTDGDGVANYLDTDSDNDYLPDASEGALGLDPLDPDSDNDGISDFDDGVADTDGDGTINALDIDSDNDGVSDADEAGDTNIQTFPVDTDNDTRPDFIDGDSDADGLIDALEVFCPALGLDSRLYDDVDGDGFSDLAEEAVGSDLCDPNSGVLDIVDFYFELPYQAPGDERDDLLFTPTVQQADVFFSVDTTGSMGGEITNLQTGLGTIITQTRSRVSDSAFGVGRWDDIPTCSDTTGFCSNSCPTGSTTWVNDGFCDDGLPGADYAVCNPGADCDDCGTRYNKYGYTSEGDIPWERLQIPTTNQTTAQTAVNQLNTHFGGDFPEAGFESLYQLATGTGGVSWPSQCDEPAGSIAAGNSAGFRAGSIPIVLHVTDAPSHTPTSYSTGNVSGAHTQLQATNALNAIGARVITVQSEGDPTAATQLNQVSSDTGARVPVCAFQTTAGWRCGRNQCCTGLNGGAVSPTGGECVLRYEINADGSGLGTAVVDGIDAIIKYGTFDVTTQWRDDGDGATPDTSCFIKAVTPQSFTPPPQEPEMSCTPPPTISGNSFLDFATGTSSSAQQGSSLTFEVVAWNDNCVAPTLEAQTFTAYIDVVDQTTGAVLDTQTVTIIVPPEIPDEF